MKATLTICALALCGTLALNAADAKKPAGDKPKPNPDDLFKKLDKNGDGKLSKEEFLGKREGEAKTKGEAAFAAKDKDKDGNLSLDEFKAAPAKKAK